MASGALRRKYVMQFHRLLVRSRLELKMLSSPHKAEDVLDFGCHIDVSLSFRDAAACCSLMEDKDCY